MATRRPLVKVALGAAALTVVGLLFAATLRDVASEPYTVRSNDLDCQHQAAEHYRSLIVDAALLGIS